VAHDGAVLFPVILIPLYLAHCVRPQAGPTAPTLAALGGAHDVCFDRPGHVVTVGLPGLGAALLYSASPLGDEGWLVRGGLSGFRLLIDYYRRMHGVHGPEVWFWFTPLRFPGRQSTSDFAGYGNTNESRTRACT